MAARLVRTCVCCRNEGRKPELLRFVLQAGVLVFDRAQRLSGRGAYVHPRPECWRKIGEVKRWRGAFGRRKGRKSAGGEEASQTLVRQADLEKVMDEVRLGGDSTWVATSSVGNRK